MVERKDKYDWLVFLVFEVICLCAGETIYKSMFKIWQCESISKRSFVFLLNLKTAHQRFVLIIAVVLQM